MLGYSWTNVDVSHIFTVAAEATLVQFKQWLRVVLMPGSFTGFPIIGCCWIFDSWRKKTVIAIVFILPYIFHHSLFSQCKVVHYKIVLLACVVQKVNHKCVLIFRHFYLLQNFTDPRLLWVWK